MSILDIVLLMLWLAAGVNGYISGSDALYKLFLGLIIGFLMYLVVASQIEMTYFLSPEKLDGYQEFLVEHSTGVLSVFLFMIPALGVFFMLHPRFSITTYKKSMGHILLWLLLPIFLVGILAHLAKGSILSGSNFWQKIFNFFENSLLYRTFETLPWVIFLLLGFLVFYKSLFLLLVAFFKWLYEEVMMKFFESWKHEKNLQQGDSHE